MELRRYVQIVWKWSWLIFLGIVLAAGSTYAISSLLPPVYRASTTLLVRTPSATGDDYGSVIVNQYLAATYSELIVKRPIIEAAAVNLGLGLSVIPELLADTEAWVIPNTSLVGLAVDHGDPSVAAELANEIVSVFIESQQDPRTRREQDVFVVESALPPEEPVSPRLLLSTVAAAIGGCVLAAGAAFLLEYLDERLSTPEDVELALSLPTLATVSGLNHYRERDGTPVVLKAPTSPASEAYRVLRATIQLPGTEEEMPNTLLVTSPSTIEEKAGVSVNLGIALAQAGLRVLLVDADMRRPHLHCAFGLANEAGLSTLLAGEASLDACVAETAVSGLEMLPAGPTSPERSFLPSSAEVRRLLDQLEARADIVLVDAAPVLTSADALVLAPYVAGTILAVNSRSTLEGPAVEAKQRLSSVRATVLGVVLNRDRGKGNSYREDGHLQ